MATNICVFGDSVGRGVIFDEIQNRYRFLKSSFAKLFSSAFGVAVDNYAAFGCTVDRGMRLMERHGDKLRESGYVLLEFGGNDCDFDWPRVSENPDLDHKPKTVMPEFKKTYREMINKVRVQGGAPVLMTLPPIDPDRYFRKISEGLSAENILRFLGDVDRIYRWHEYYSLAICALAAETGTLLIDVRSAFIERKNCFEMICEDGIHPNEKGHELISQTLSAFALNLLTQGQPVEKRTGFAECPS